MLYYLQLPKVAMQPRPGTLRPVGLIIALSFNRPFLFKFEERSILLTLSYKIYIYQVKPKWIMLILASTNY